MVTFLAAPAFAQADVPLSPTDAWNVDSDTCVALRRFGVGDGALSFGFQPVGVGKLAFDLVLILPKGRPVWFADATVLLGLASGLKFNTSFTTWRIQKSDPFVTRIALKEMPPSAIAAAPEIDIVMGKELVRVAPGPLEKLFGMLSACHTERLSGWGVDVAKQALVATPAVPNGTGDSRSYQDYPIEALRREQQGTSTVVWHIDEAGKVVDCRTVISSGYASLDDAACRAVMRKGRYTSPAKDASGNPVESWMSESSSFWLPDPVQPPKGSRPS